MKELLKKLSHLLDDRTYLKIKYYLKMHKKLNLNNPQTFNEKLQWLKLYDRNPLYTTMVDKYEVKKLANQLNIGDKVEFRGNVNNLNEILPTCEIFVPSSNYERMLNALIETMTIGLPCISTNCPCGGPKEPIDNDINGILTEVNSEEQLTESLRKLLTDKNKRNQLEKNAKSIIKLYNPEIIYDKWINLINER